MRSRNSVSQAVTPAAAMLNCQTPQTACKTIGHGISLAASGDSIIVEAATYSENLTIGSSLAKDRTTRGMEEFMKHTLITHCVYRRTTIAAALIGFAFLLGAFLAPTAEAQTETVLHSFPGSNVDGYSPYSGLLMDAAGNLYGTTFSGGSSSNCSGGCGTVFELSSSGIETVLYSFTGSANGDGANPYAGLFMDAAGNLYGTTYGGGTSGLGTVFKLTPSGSETVLHSFTGSANGDGANPTGDLIMDKVGNLYGTTYNGGTSGNGTVFVASIFGVEASLYSFTGSNGDGAHPFSGLIFGRAGELYGTTYQGGASGTNCAITCGTVFKVTRFGAETVLYSFTGANGDGANPDGRLVLGGGGTLYGTTTGGGASRSGTVFKLAPSGKETVLYSFMGANGDGGNPASGLITDKAGNFYGTTTTGGLVDPYCQFGACGTVFKVTPSGSVTVLYRFRGPDNADGATPWGLLLMDVAGNLYGTALNGGASLASNGGVFKIAP